MEKWTIERLYELWRNRGYSKKAAKNMAEKEKIKKGIRKNFI